MLLFLLLLFPVSLVLYFTFTKEKKFLLVVYMGFITAVIVCAVAFITSYPHRIIPDSFFKNYLYYFIKITFLPMLLLPAAFCVFSKNSPDFKAKSIFPLMASFYVVFLPYHIMSLTDSRYSLYDISLRPIIYLAMIIQIAYAAKRLVHSIEESNQAQKTKNIIAIVIYLLYPAFADTCFISLKFIYIACVLSAGYIAYSGLCLFKEYKLIKNQ